MRRAELQGKRFGMLTVVGLAEVSIGRTRWNVICDCGAERIVYQGHLASGHTRSCGCGRPPTPDCTTHGLSKTKTYATWVSMKERCSNPGATGWQRYGGRGIKVCERWMSFENFLVDMGERPDGTTLDRINNEGNYEPGNCRWATADQQNANKRNSISLTIEGRTLCLKQWCRELGVKSGTVWYRISRGMTPMEALTAKRRTSLEPK